jgi:hypothetical protein
VKRVFLKITDGEQVSYVGVDAIDALGMIDGRVVIAAGDQSGPVDQPLEFFTQYFDIVEYLA